MGSLKYTFLFNVKNMNVAAISQGT